MKTVAAIALSVVCASSYAAPALEFKSLPLGSSQSATQRKFPGTDCLRDTCLWSPPAADFGPARILSVSFRFVDDRLETVLVTFASSSFDATLTALVAKYGPPSSIERGAVQNRMGATFPNQSALWDLPDGHLMAAQRNARVDQSGVMYFAKGAQERIEAADQARAKATAGTL